MGMVPLLEGATVGTMFGGAVERSLPEISRLRMIKSCAVGCQAGGVTAVAFSMQGRMEGYDEGYNDATGKKANPVNPRDEEL